MLRETKLDRNLIEVVLRLARLDACLPLMLASSLSLNLDVVQCRTRSVTLSGSSYG